MSPVFGVTGWKNSGKTGLMTRLIAHFTEAGMDVASVKHAHHSARVDHPGTDSDRHRQAGARQVILASPARWALMNEGAAPELPALLARLSPCDLVLIEGYKTAPHPKLECHRAAAAAAPLLAGENPSIRAVASDDPGLIPPRGLPRLDLDDTAAIADFILAELRR